MFDEDGGGDRGTGRSLDAVVTVLVKFFVDLHVFFQVARPGA